MIKIFFYSKKSIKYLKMYSLKTKLYFIKKVYNSII
jgi:hypothetical protein